ncbi:hypothetical protein KY289_007996 [Solanum tuberosum]|nr:hypothetical protein KY289_007996 [Solanum tuberosum]
MRLQLVIRYFGCNPGVSLGKHNNRPFPKGMAMINEIWEGGLRKYSFERYSTVRPEYVMVTLDRHPDDTL